MISLNKRLTLILLLSCMNVSANTPQNNLPTTQDTIYVASEPDYPPFCIVNKSGEVDGFSVELFNEAASAMKLNAIIKVGTWNTIKKELAEGKIDALPLVGRTPEREENFDFTFPYYTVHGAVFVRKGTTGISSLDDLKNKDILVMKGDNAEEYAIRESISSKIISTDTFTEAFELLSGGQHDAVIAQRLMGLQLLNRLEFENIIPLDIELTGFSQDFCFAVKDGDKNLLAYLNEGLAIVIANGKYRELHQKWFSPILDVKIPLKRILISMLYILIPLTILILIISVLASRAQIHDRTKHLKLEIHEREKAEAALRESNKLKELLLDIITHDIKNPAGAIHAMAEIMLERDSDNEMLDIIKGSSDKLLQVMDNTTTLAQVTLGDKIKVEELDLTELIKSVVNEFNSQFKQSEMLLEIELPEKLYLQANPIISAVFKNYISNAIKYATTGKTILVDSEERDGFLTINVKDFGSTIPEVHRQKVFDRTYQIDDKKRGRGLGLAIVKRIAEAHNAEVGVRPNEPTGNIFYIRIPIQ